MKPWQYTVLTAVVILLCAGVVLGALRVIDWLYTLTP